MGRGPPRALSARSLPSWATFRCTSTASGSTPRARSLLEIVDPATEEVVARVANGGAEDAKAAVLAARRAFDEGPWPHTPAAERAAVLRAAAALVRERVDEMARWESLEMGKLFADGQGDISRVADLLDYAGELAERFLADQPITEPTALVREPVGVVVGVCPWNFPLVLASFKFASALAAGNVVIIKPASISPLTALGMARIFDEVGLPKGVFQVVIGPGRSVGDYLVGSPLVDMVTLTGSVEVGRHIMTQAAKTVKKVGLELGGKAPNTVFADADFDAALDGVVFSAFGNCGQACCAGSRLLVERSIHEQLRRRRGGPCRGFAYRSRSRPSLRSSVRCRRVNSATRGALRGDRPRRGRHASPAAAGASRARASSSRPRSSSMSTTTCASPRRRSSGPCSSVIPFDYDDDAVRIANDSVFGLSGGVWTSDTDKAKRYVRAVRAGTVFVNNTWACAPLGLPWGGFKQSGIGREIGDVGIEEFTELKAVIFAGA